jgi:hypothetical protein
MTTITNSFEYGGSTAGQGAQITTANSGGGADTAFNGTNSGAGLTYDGTHAIHSSYSANITTPSGGGTYGMYWSSSLTSSPVTQAWFRAYCYFPANPSATLQVIRCLGSFTFRGRW